MNSEATTVHDAGVSRHWLLKTLLAQHVATHEADVGGERLCRDLRVIAVRLAGSIEAHYCDALGLTPPLSIDQFVLLLNTLHADLQLAFTLQQANAQEVAYLIEQCPWDDLLGDIPESCYLMSCLYGALAARNFGEAAVRIEALSARQHGCCLLRLLLHPHDALPGDMVLTREETLGTARAAVPADAASADQHGFEILYRQQVDLTERLEQALEMERAATEQLRAFNRLKQDFLSNVSHEFRTPITAIQGYLSLMAQDAMGPLTEEQRETVQIALRNTDRLHRLVSDVLDFSALSRGQFVLESELVEVGVILAQALHGAAEAAQLKGIALRSETGDSLGKIIGDQERLVQMIVHLLENAIKFSQSGQAVLLSAHRRPHQVVIEIRDAGIGMTEEQLAHVFTPFKQGDTGLNRRFGGLGMGLSLIHNLVALHGGEISISSQPGRGTTVRVALPLYDE